MEYAIRPAVETDAVSLLGLIDALADYEHLPRPGEAARQRLATDLRAKRFQALLVEAEAKAVAYAIWFFTYSTFLARPTLYLEDVFVLPDHRQRGIATGVMRWLSKRALDEGCGRMEWQVLDWNKLARGFYENLGARHLVDWLPYRLTREELEALSRG